MESKSKGPQNRGGNRSGGKGGNYNRNNNRSRNNNRNRNRNRNRSRRRRKPEPKPTTGQKILAFLTFGKLGKPKRKPQHKPKSKTTTAKKAPAKKKPQRKPRKVEVTTPRLYVGNLSYDANEADLEELFKGAGNVMSAEVVTNARTQQSKGFAFVEMGSIDEAKRAVEILNDEDFMGRRLNINGARSEGPRESSAA